MILQPPTSPLSNPKAVLYSWLSLSINSNISLLLGSTLTQNSRECEENSVNLNSRTAFYDKINS